MPPKTRKPKQDPVVGHTKNDSRKTRDEPSTQNGVGAELATLTIPSQSKEIVAERHGSTDFPLNLIFTHGAGGGITNPATRTFAEGASKHALVYSFQGSMNLKSRIKLFHAVIEHLDIEQPNLGGRSMGARAAVQAAGDYDTPHLVLVSYPLVGANGSVRDEILLDIDPKVKVLFISGDGDNMCKIQQLNAVRKKMKAKTWLAIVKGADHGMSLKPKMAVEPMRQDTGELAVKWMQKSDPKKTECELSWDAESEKVVNEGWKAPGKSTTVRTAPDTADSKEEPADTDEKPAKRRRKR